MFRISTESSLIVDLLMSMLVTLLIVFLVVVQGNIQLVNLCIGTSKQDGQGGAWWQRTEKEDLHKEIKNPILHKLMHVQVRLELFGCLVHLNCLLQGWDDSKDQKCNTENKLGNSISKH